MSHPPSVPERGLDRWLDQVVTADCVEYLAELPDSCVELVLCDLPYGTTANRWDTPLDLGWLWGEYDRLLTPGGAVVLTAAQPFTAQLVVLNPAWFRGEWIWRKTVGSGQLNIRRRPLQTHESVLVFAPAPPAYTPQMRPGDPYKVRRKPPTQDGSYGTQREVVVENPGLRYPTSVVTIPNPRVRGGHPTQKPVALCRYFIETYSSPGAVVLDHCAGSGSTAVAAFETGRHFLACELSADYTAMAYRNLTAAGWAPPVS
jgi:site-specific DNA-methyltransferase (adenine-specific)